MNTIDENQLDKIFNLYEKNNIDGTGIGLYTVKRNVNMFGYEILVQNMDRSIIFNSQEDLMFFSVE